MVSLPLPPFIKSLPLPALILSLPAYAYILSFFLLPLIVSSFDVAFIVVPLVAVIIIPFSSNNEDIDFACLKVLFAIDVISDSVKLLFDNNSFNSDISVLESAIPLNDEPNGLL